jgi:hypothetical protein
MRRPLKLLSKRSPSNPSLRLNPRLLPRKSRDPDLRILIPEILTMLLLEDPLAEAAEVETEVATEVAEAATEVTEAASEETEEIEEPTEVAEEAEVKDPKVEKLFTPRVMVMSIRKERDKKALTEVVEALEGATEGARTASSEAEEEASSEVAAEEKEEAEAEAEPSVPRGLKEKSPDTSEKLLTEKREK